MQEIEKNDFNLTELHQQLVAIARDIDKAKDKHNAFLKELGLPLLP